MTIFGNQKIMLKERFSSNLAFRQNADDLFDYVKSLPGKKIIFDFTDVTSMSRSFAHQYLHRKKTCEKEIIEIGEASDIKRMFDIVEKGREKKSVFDIKNMKVLVIQ